MQLKPLLTIGAWRHDPRHILVTIEHEHDKGSRKSRPNPGGRIDR
jgi:hypothetical protein